MLMLPLAIIKETKSLLKAVGNKFIDCLWLAADGNKKYERSQSDAKLINVHQ